MYYLTYKEFILLVETKVYEKLGIIKYLKTKKIFLSRKFHKKCLKKF